MDKPIEKRPLPIKRYSALGVFALVIALIGYLLAFTDFDSQRVDREKLRFGSVKHGVFRVEVSGNGRIMPRDIEWVVPRVTGEVEVVAVTDGDRVNKGQLLISLRSDELKSSLTKVRSRLAQANANLATKAFDLNAQRTNYESDLIRARFQLEEAQALYDAHSQLMAMPNPPISRIDYSKTAIAVKRMRSMVEVSSKVLENFAQLESSQLEEAKARVAEVEEELAQVKKRFEELQIVANRDGVIQDLDLKVGQRVGEGVSIAKISDPQDIYVELKVPAYQALKLAKNQKSTIELHQQEYEGIIERIDPNVKGTTIDVDIALTSSIPDARVDMFVSGVIHVQDVGKTFYVERPANSIENGLASVYRVSENGKAAERIRVDMGSFSANHVQILSGLEEGDEIILTDLNEYDDAELLTLY